MAGFDHIPIAAHVSPGLTTVRADVATWGQLAAALLLAEVQRRTIEVPALEPPRLVIRGSTGPPPRAGAGTR